MYNIGLISISVLNIFLIVCIWKLFIRIIKSQNCHKRCSLRIVNLILIKMHSFETGHIIQIVLLDDTWGTHHFNTTYAYSITLVNQSQRIRRTMRTKCQRNAAIEWYKFEDICQCHMRITIIIDIQYRDNIARK